MVAKTLKPSELKQIRIALGLKQEEMAELLGLKSDAQNTYSGWERNPRHREHGKALERAKEIYKSRTNSEWKGAGIGDDGVTRDEFIELRGGMKERLAALEEDVEDAWEVIRFLISRVPPESRPKVRTKRPL